jgi:hypothetical protein
MRRLTGWIFKQEKSTVGHVQSQVSGPSISLKRKATIDIIMIEDDPVVSHLFLVQLLAAERGYFFIIDRY